MASIIISNYTHSAVITISSSLILCAGRLITRAAGPIFKIFSQCPKTQIFVTTANFKIMSSTFICPQLNYILANVYVCICFDSARMILNEWKKRKQNWYFKAIQNAWEFCCILGGPPREAWFLLEELNKLSFLILHAVITILKCNHIIHHD